MSVLFLLSNRSGVILRLLSDQQDDFGDVVRIYGMHITDRSMIIGWPGIYS